MAIKALFTGSFDPLTNGHLDLIRRASGMYDNLVVGVIMNPSKKSMFTADERKKMIGETVSELPNVSVDSFDGLLADYVNSNGFDVIVRGLRGTGDFEYELQMAHMNARLFDDGIETVFLMTKPEYASVSSSVVKEIFSLGGKVEGLVPETILKYMKDKK